MSRSSFCTAFVFFLASRLVFIMVFACHPATISSLSHVKTHTCPSLRSVGVDSLRHLFIKSGVSNMDLCLSSFGERPQSPLTPTADSFRSVDFSLATGKAKKLGSASISACRARGNRTCVGTATEKPVHECCSTTDLSLVNASRQHCKRWISRCTPNRFSNTTFLVCAAVGLMPKEANVTDIGCDFIASPPCCILHNNTSDSNQEIGLAAQDTPCGSNGFVMPLHPLAETYSLSFCLEPFIVNTSRMIEDLASVESRFRKVSFPNINEENATKHNSSSFEFPISKQAEIVLCHSIFHTQVNQTLGGKKNFTSESPHLPLCGNTCHRLRNILNNLGKFADMRGVPMMSYLQENTQEFCEQSPSNTRTCIDFDQNLTSFQRPSSETPRPLFCLNLTCPFPYRATSNSHHWLKSSQDRLKDYHSVVQEILPSVSKPFNGSHFPCGHDCVSVVFSKNEDRLTQRVKCFLGVLSVFTNLVAIGAYVLNRSKLNHTARRINAYLNVFNVIGVGLDQVVFGLPGVCDNIACYKDGTLRQNEPNANEGVTACVLFALKTIFSASMGFTLDLALSLEWYLMTVALGNVQKWNRFLKREKLREKLYLTACLTFSMAATMAPVFTKSLEGFPYRGGCALKSSSLLYIQAVPFLIAVPPITFFLCVGLPKLHRIYKDVRTLPGRVEDTSTSSKTERRKSAISIGSVPLQDLIKLLTVYAVTSLLTGVFIAGLTIFKTIIEDGVNHEIQTHVNCAMASCYPEHCPPLPSRGILWEIVREVYATACCIVFSLWAFNWNAYWKEHLSLSWRRESNASSTASAAERRSNLTWASHDTHSDCLEQGQRRTSESRIPSTLVLTSLDTPRAENRSHRSNENVDVSIKIEDISSTIVE